MPEETGGQPTPQPTPQPATGAQPSDAFGAGTHPTPQGAEPGSPARPAGGVPPAPEPSEATREWLRSVGVAVRDVRPRPEPVREIPRPEPSAGYVPPDVIQLRDVLKTGSDEQFIDGVLQASSARVRREQQIIQRDQRLGEQINSFVSKHAPELPLVVFWAMAAEAEARFPGELDKQIDWAIQQGQATMTAHNEGIANRTRERDASAQESDTLDGTPTDARRRTGGRRRSASAETEEPDETFVETLLKAQAGRFGG